MKHLITWLLVVLVVVVALIANTIYPVLPRVANLTKAASNMVIGNWQDFLFGLGQDVDLDETATSTLSAQIGAEVAKALEAKWAELDRGPSSGLVVLPPGQAADPNMIANSFSDEVVVRPDNTGQSGVIMPVFKSGNGQPYIYILTPIKQ